MPISFIIRRFLFALPTLIGISLVAFSLSYLTPGDPALAALGLDADGTVNIDKADVERVREELGLNEPFYIQYAGWLGRAITGNFGRSYVMPYDVRELVAQALPTTLLLMFGTMGVAALLGIPLGIVSALKPDGPTDYVARVTAVTGVSLPVFWEALILILLLAYIFPIFPISGSIQEKGWIAGVLPVLALATHPAALIARMMRSSMLEVLTQDYVRTATAKGLSRGKVVVGHALRNALNPVITVMGFQFGSLIGGAVVVEHIFALPGMGALLINAIYTKDLIVTQGVVLVVSLVFVGANLVVDLLYGLLDPRIRY